MSFAEPAVLWIGGLAVALLLLGHGLDELARRRALARLGDAAQLGRMIVSSSPRRRVVKIALFTLGFAGVMVALARPRVLGEAVWRERGIDIAVVMDYSKSMLADDLGPSRLVVMREEAEALMVAREGDRIGVVVFAGAAAHFPLTSDQAAARSLYEGLRPADLPPGSNLGEALRVARCVLRPDSSDDGDCGRVGGRGGGGNPLPGRPGPPRDDDRGRQLEERGRAMVVFTDGDDRRGDAALQVAEAMKHGIAVYFVGVGTAAGARVPEVNERGDALGWKHDAAGNVVVSRLDEAALRALAEVAGGSAAAEHFDVLEPGKTAPKLRERLDDLKRGALERRQTRQPKHIYQLFLFPALLLLLIEACLADRRRRHLRKSHSATRL